MDPDPHPPCRSGTSRSYIIADPDPHHWYFISCHPKVWIWNLHCSVLCVLFCNLVTLSLLTFKHCTWTRTHRQLRNNYCALPCSFLVWTRHGADKAWEAGGGRHSLGGENSSQVSRFLNINFAEPSLFWLLAFLAPAQSEYGYKS